MFVNALRGFAVVLVLALLQFAGFVPVRSWGVVPKVTEPSPLFRGRSIPEPPQQHARWNPPTSKIPKEFVSAASLLFDHGLGDPRGCEYRAISVATGSCWTGDGGVVHTHGWVLPAKGGEKERFAVCWNGLVYPLVTLGDKADLKQDVKATIERRKKENDNNQQISLPETGEGWSLWEHNLGDHATALLLRAGEEDLASALWVVNHAPAKENSPEGSKVDPYLSLADSWAWVQFDRALGAHMRGEDVVALHGFRRLSAFAQAARGEAKKRGFKPDKNESKFLHFLGQLPDLLADQEQRAKETREAMVCIGPGREPSATNRIAGLIARLDEVSARQWGQPGGVSMGEDPVVKALIREGEPALESLLKCFKEDRRLTRSVHFWRDFSRSRTCLGVHEAAYVALSTILSQSDFEPASTGDNLTSRGDEGRKQLVGLIRKHVKTAKRVPRAQRWFAVLEDDKARPDTWSEAAQRLMSADDMAAAPGTMVWSGTSVRLRPGKAKRELLGERLRQRTDPSLTEVLLKRIGQSDDVHVSADLALALSVWEPKSAMKPLAEQMKRLRDNGQWYGYVIVVQRRCELQDLKALDDYVEVIGRATPKMLGEHGHSNLFYPMADHPDHPGMAGAAKKLFGDSMSPWLPLVRNQSARAVHELITTKLLRVPAFRSAVIQELRNKSGDGTIRVDKNGSMSMNLPDVTNSYGGGWGWRELDIPEEGAGHKFRICDFVAWKISAEIPAAPRCELYWSQDQRDQAVLACGEFLRRYGAHLFRDNQALVHNRPATRKDDLAGKAVFSLEGEGETRVMTGLKLPLDARWRTLKHRPYLEEIIDPKSGKTRSIPAYRQDGQVVQVEEVRKDGKWHRYYGFVGSNQIARVPASEIEFPPDRGWGWRERRDWVALRDGFHGKLNVPPLTIEPFEKLPPRIPADAVLTFSITLRNSLGADQRCPEIEKTARLRLLYSAEVIASQGMLTPNAVRESEWVKLRQKLNAPLQAEKVSMLGPTAELKVATIDLRQWFDMSKPGFYRLQLLPIQQQGELGVGLSAEVQFSLAPPEHK